MTIAETKEQYMRHAEDAHVVLQLIQTIEQLARRAEAAEAKLQTQKEEGDGRPED